MFKIPPVPADYTFFCALHPAMRRDWAAGYARLLAPGALLACLAFPIVPAGEHPTGPPWPVKPQDYMDVLLPLGELACFVLVECCLLEDAQNEEWQWFVRLGGLVSCWFAGACSSVGLTGAAFLCHSCPQASRSSRSTLCLLSCRTLAAAARRPCCCSGRTDAS